MFLHRSVIRRQRVCLGSSFCPWRGHHHGVLLVVAGVNGLREDLALRCSVVITQPDGQDLLEARPDARQDPPLPPVSSMPLGAPLSGSWSFTLQSALLPHCGGRAEKLTSRCRVAALRPSSIPRAREITHQECVERSSRTGYRRSSFSVLFTRDIVPTPGPGGTLLAVSRAIPAPPLSCVQAPPRAAPRSPAWPRTALPPSPFISILVVPFASL